MSFKPALNRLNTIGRIVKFKTLLENWTVVWNTFKSFFYFFIGSNGTTAGKTAVFTWQALDLFVSWFGSEV